MDQIALFLSNPFVSLIGYVFSLLASIVAVVQFVGKSKYQKRVSALEIEINHLQTNTLNKNKIHQGDKSQYFQENSGPVVIDNRGD